MALPELYFFHREECETCSAALPVFETWKTEHPEVMAISLNCTRMNWRKYGYRPRMIPAYLLVVDGRKMQTIEGGLMSTKQIDKFVKIASQ